MDSYDFWRLVLNWAQLLFIPVYAAVVAAFLLELKRRYWRVPIYFSGLFFLALCPFFILFAATVYRLWPIFHSIDGIGNGQQMLSYAVQPLYLGAGTSLLLVTICSVLYAWHRQHQTPNPYGRCQG